MLTKTLCVNMKLFVCKQNNFMLRKTCCLNMKLLVCKQNTFLINMKLNFMLLEIEFIYIMNVNSENQNK
jgi:hypothetical protein